MRLNTIFGRHWKKIIVYVIVLVLCFLWVLPIWSTFLIAFKSTQEYAIQKFWQLPTQNYFWSNFLKAWIQAGLGRHFVNSIFYGLIGAWGAIFLSSLAAFSIAGLKIKGSFGWFFLIWSGTLFPFQMYLIPLFKMYVNLHLYNKFWGMALFYVAICIPFCTFVFRNFFLTLPREIFEAARIEGCSNFQVYWRIYMPLSKSVISFLLLFQFTWIWNDLMFGLILTRSIEARPIMVGLGQLHGFGGSSGTHIPSLMAGALIASVPSILLFVALQKYFMKGMRLTTAGE